MQLSIIVPVYNVENTLSRCLDSILRQTFKDYELLLIDGGSTDKSGLICDEYADKDKRIRVFHKINGGASSARNVGLDNAQGKYIGFVDSDDWVVADMYEYLIARLESTKSDVVRAKRIETNGNIYFVQGKITEKVFEGEDILLEYMYRGTKEGIYGVCDFVYKKSLFDNLRIPIGIIYEDINTNFQLLQMAQKMIVVNKVVYYYYQGNESVTRGQLKLKDLDLLEVTSRLMELCNKTKNKRLIFLAKVKKARSYFSFLSKIAYYGISSEIVNKEKIINQFTRELRKNIFLLLFSPISFCRKVLAISFCLNYSIAEKLICLYKITHK